VVVGWKTAFEAVFSVTGKSGSTAADYALTGVVRLRGYVGNLAENSTVNCLNNEEFFNQYETLFGRFSDMVDTVGLDVAQIATPANPSAGRNKIYPKTGGKFYSLTSAGVESILATEAYVSASLSTDGWTASSNTWVFATASTFTIAGVDLTTTFTKGTRLKFTQTTVKYAVVVSSSFSTNTTVTIAVNTDHTIANAAITLPFYSYQNSPQGYPGTFNWTTTWGGFSANPTGTFKYSIEGNIVSVYFTDASGGTSNATTLTFTVPVASLSAASAIPCFVGDNGANVAQPGHLQLGAASATVSVYKSFYQGAFTNVNGKGLFFKLLQYDF